MKQKTRQELIDLLNKQSSEVTHLESRCVKLGTEIEQNRIDLRRLSDNEKWLKSLIQHLVELAKNRSRVI